MDRFDSQDLIAQLGVLNKTLTRVADALERLAPKAAEAANQNIRLAEGWDGDNYRGPYGYGSQDR